MGSKHHHLPTGELRGQVLTHRELWMRLSRTAWVMLWVRKGCFASSRRDTWEWRGILVSVVWSEHNTNSIPSEDSPWTQNQHFYLTMCHFLYHKNYQTKGWKITGRSMQATVMSYEPSRDQGNSPKRALSMINFTVNLMGTKLPGREFLRLSL